MKTSKDVADEVWAMLPDDCKNIMQSIRESFKESIVADIDDLLSQRQLGSTTKTKYCERCEYEVLYPGRFRCKKCGYEYSR